MEIWKKNIKILRESRKWTKSELSRRPGVSVPTISRYENEGGKSYREAYLKRLADTFECDFADLFKSPESETREDTKKRCKVCGEIWPEDLKLVAEWVIEQEEPIKMAANIRFMVETRYPKFEEWLKKRGEEGKIATLPGKVIGQ